MKKISCVCVLLVCGLSVFSQNRSFDTLFPQLDPAKRGQVFSPEGLVISAKTKTLQLSPSSEADIDIAGSVLRRNPSYLAESLLVIQTHRPVDFLQIYNALRNIQGLKGRLYHSVTRNDDIPLFEEATRIVSERRTSPIPDPPKALAVPASETIYIRLKDINFGNSYYRGDITGTQKGLLYSLSNVKSLSYLFIPVIKEDKFVAQLYFEPLVEGVLVYSIAGADVSDFIASHIHIPSAIQKRLEVIIQWVVEGITTNT